MLQKIRRRLGMTPEAPSPVYLSQDTPMIDHHEARTAQLDGAALIDVREPEEWQLGHIADALLCPLPQLASDPDLDIDLERPIVTYCKIGARAERAAEILTACGYKDVRVMAGGYADWRAAGYPVA